jgi:hypothetical protein
MAGLVPAIHVFVLGQKDVDARDKRGHDGGAKTCMASQLGLARVAHH